MKKQTPKRAVKRSRKPTTRRKSATSPTRSKARASSRAGRTAKRTVTVRAPSFAALNRRAEERKFEKDFDTGVALRKAKLRVMRARRAAGQYGLMTETRDPHDNYETPEIAIDQLLSNVKLTTHIWDPSCGRGKIVKALLDRQLLCIGSDKYRPESRIDDPPLREVLEFGIDFLDVTTSRGTTIVMNPPFSQADKHVRHALQITPSNGMVCVLLRLTWMSAKKRSDLLKHLWKIVICGRLKMLPPDVPDKGHSGTVDFAWFVFVPHVVGSTTITRAR